MENTGICSVRERHQLGLTTSVSRVNCHVRSAAVRIVDSLDQSPTGARAELE